MKQFNVILKMRLPFIIFLLVLISVLLRAQSSDSVYQFSIKQAVDYALMHQNNILNAQLDAEISDEKVREVVGIGLPQINANFDLKDYEKIPTQLIPAEFFGGNAGSYEAIQFGTRWNATASVTASQILFDPAYLIGVRASKTFRELSRKNLEQTKLETAISVTKGYYILLLLNQRSGVIDANVTRIQKLFDDTKALYKNGFVEKLDLDRVQVALNNIKSEQEKFHRLIEVSGQNLKFQIGLPDKAQLITTDTLNEEAVKNLSVSDGKSDPSRRIEYSLLKSRERVQEFSLKRYRSQFYPSLIAYGSLSAAAQRTEFDVFESGKRWYPTGIVGVTFNLPIFDGAQRNHRVHQEKLSLRKIENDIQNFENSVNLEISTSRSGLEDALSTLHIQQDNLDLATSLTKTTKIKYDQGVGSNLEVLDAETSLKEAQANYYNALYDAIIAKINLDKAAGNFNY